MRIIDTPKPVFVFCPDATCPGYECQERKGIQREVERTVLDEGVQDSPYPNAVSTSFFRHFVPSKDTDDDGYATAAQLQCEHCGRELQVSPDPRPEYANISGQDPMTLLMRRKDAERTRERDGELAELRGTVAALTAMLAGQNADGPQKPGRKAKAPESEAA